MRNYLYDSKNRKIGYTEQHTNRTDVYDAGNRKLGWFDHTTGKTYTTGNKLIGTGDLTGSLLHT